MRYRVVKKCSLSTCDQSIDIMTVLPDYHHVWLYYKTHLEFLYVVLKTLGMSERFSRSSTLPSSLAYTGGDHIALNCLLNLLGNTKLFYAFIPSYFSADFAHYFICKKCPFNWCYTTWAGHTHTTSYNANKKVFVHRKTWLEWSKQHKYINKDWWRWEFKHSWRECTCIQVFYDLRLFGLGIYFTMLLALSSLPIYILLTMSCKIGKINA